MLEISSRAFFEILKNFHLPEAGVTAPLEEKQAGWRAAV
jgi:hypothetical protein